MCLQQLQGLMMFKVATRFFSIGRTLGNSAVPPAVQPVKVSPVLAARQIIPENASKSRRKSSRRREKRLKSQIIRDVNNLKQVEIRSFKFQVDPVLGSPDCAFIKRLNTALDEPTHLAYGFEREEFEKLLYGAQKASLDQNIAGDEVAESIFAIEEKKRKALLNILHMKNTNAKDKKKLAIKLAREEFQREEGDTASPEVQAAVLTARIHSGWDHVKNSFKDKVHSQYIRQLVHKRQRILKYLKKDNPEQYFYAIAKLGLTDDVITNEFNMGRQYFQDFKVFGDKQLVKPSNKEKAKAAKVEDLKKRVQDYNRLAKENYEALYGKPNPSA